LRQWLTRVAKKVVIPRKSGGTTPSHLIVIPRACGVSSTPRLLGSITAASGILDRPHARAMTSGKRRRAHQTQLRLPAAPIARVLQILSAQRGRGECRAPDAPAASRAIEIEAHERSHHRSTRNVPAFPHANGFNGFLRALPGDEFLFVTVTCGLRCRQTRLGSPHLRRFSISNGCQDHTASPSATASFVFAHRSIAHEVHLALRSHCAPDAAASTASRPNVGDDGRRPSSGRDGGSASADLPDDESGIFLREGLDAFY
jgi:hypothetical protein